MKKYLEIGKIISVHGLKGDVKVEPWCNEPEFICEFDKLYSKDGKKEFEVERSRVQKNMVIMKLKGVDSERKQLNASAELAHCLVLTVDYQCCSG